MSFFIRDLGKSNSRKHKQDKERQISKSISDQGLIQDPKQDSLVKSDIIPKKLDSLK